jgi:hypothetical protein
MLTALNILSCVKLDPGIVAVTQCQKLTFIKHILTAGHYYKKIIYINAISCEIGTIILAV